MSEEEIKRMGGKTATDIDKVDNEHARDILNNSKDILELRKDVTRLWQTVYGNGSPGLAEKVKSEITEQMNHKTRNLQQDDADLGSRISNETMAREKSVEKLEKAMEKGFSEMRDAWKETSRGLAQTQLKMAAWGGGAGLGAGALASYIAHLIK